MSAPAAIVASTTAQPTDWRRALREAIRSLDELARALDLPREALDAYEPARREFPLRVPRSFVRRMRKGDPADPLLLQVLPLAAELATPPGFTLDPLAEVGAARAGILEKYAGRALLIAAEACPVHCRYCFRRHFPYTANLASREDGANAVAHLSRRPDLREVILSGGDPLSLGNRRLGALVARLDAVPTLETLRVHTRFPIMVPERVDGGLCRLLESTRLQVVIVVHTNHANEIDADVLSALKRLRDAGATLLNQSVLLHGVNASADALEALSLALFAGGVLPYYLHQLDRVSGTAHFEVPDAVAVEIVNTLRTRLPGYLVPRLVRERPGELSKTPLF